jgi:hypothetical protein
MAVTTLNGLAKRMRSLSKDIARETNEIAKQTANVVLETLVIAMPVDTSQAVSNWQIGLGSPNTNTIGPHYPGKGGSTRNQSSTQTLSIGRILISSKKPGVALHITNAVDYIEKIDASGGSSMPGFSSKGINAGVRFAASAKLKIKL